MMAQALPAARFYQSARGCYAKIAPAVADLQHGMLSYTRAISPARQCVENGEGDDHGEYLAWKTTDGSEHGALGVQAVLYHLPLGLQSLQRLSHMQDSGIIRIERGGVGCDIPFKVESFELAGDVGRACDTFGYCHCANIQTGLACCAEACM